MFQIPHWKRKWMILLCLLSLQGGLLSGCRDTKPEKPPAVPNMKVGVLLYKADDTFVTSILRNFQQAAKEWEQQENIKITINAMDGKWNQTTQIDELDKMIEQDYDVICVNLVDRTAAASVIDKARSAEIPLIFFNREPVKEDLERWEKVYYVGAVASQSGMLQGQIVADAYKANPSAVDKNGDGVIQYVMLEGEQGHQDALLRTEYSIKMLSASGVKSERLANDTANWMRAQAVTKMSQWITTMPDKIEVVFANNDDMALGAIDAYQAAGIELPLIIGIDGTAPAMTAIREGTLYGTVLNDAQMQAETMFRLCYNLVFHKEVDDGVNLIKGKYVRAPYKMVTGENIDAIEQKE